MAKQSRTLDVKFPLGGLSKRLAYQSQPDFTTVSSVNTRPEATLEKRLRGGSRPGLVKSFIARIGSGNPVYMATIMRSQGSENRATFSEDFSSLSEWDDMTFAAGGIRVIAGQANVNAPDDSGSVLQAGSLTNIEDSNNIINSTYTVEVYIDTLGVAGFGDTDIFLYCRLDDTTPAEATGVIARVKWRRGAGKTLYLDLAQDGLGTFPANTVDSIVLGALAGDFWLKLTIESGMAMAEVIPGSTAPFSKLTGTISLSAPVANESRVGLRIDNSDTGSLSTILDDFRVRYFDATGGRSPEALVATSKHDGATGKQGSNVWHEANNSEMVEVVCDRDSGGIGEKTDLNHGIHIMAVDRLGKLYIADHGVRKEDSDGTFSADGLTFDDVAGTDWSEATDIVGVDPDGDWLEIFSVGDEGLAVLNVYKITAASAAGVTISAAGSTGAVTGGIRYRIVRGPKIFDPAATTGNRLVRWEPTAGSIPLGCTILEIFRDRAVFSGDPETPGIYYMSRSGDFLDFNYFAPNNDRARATADLTTSSDGGQLSLPMSAIVSITEDYAIFSAESSMFLLRGDPTVGGIMGNISNQIGIGSRTAHCRIPDGSVVFMSRDGLYRFHPSNPKPESISRNKLPQDLIDVVQNTDLTVTLEYDVRFRGVHIFIAPKTAGPAIHYWFDWDTQSFWPTTLNNQHEPFSLVYDAKANHVLMGGRDGYMRHFSAAASVDKNADDTDSTINGHVFYGPFNLGGSGMREGAINDLWVTLDAQSGDAVVDVFVGDDPEQALGSSSVVSKTVSAGRSNRLVIRARGASGFVRVSDSSGSKWAIDSMTLVRQRNGKQR